MQVSLRILRIFQEHHFLLNTCGRLLLGQSATFCKAKTRCRNADTIGKVFLQGSGEVAGKLLLGISSSKLPLGTFDRFSVKPSINNSYEWLRLHFNEDSKLSSGMAPHFA